MLTFQTIVAPTDFSEPSKQGVQAAEELARRDGGECVLIHVVAPVPLIPPGGPPAHSGLELSGVMDKLEAAARSSLDAMVEAMAANGVRVRGEVVLGTPAEEIALAAEREHAGLIVIATHGWTGWRRFVFGSVAEKVVRLASCPVLTIPAPEGEV